MFSAIAVAGPDEDEGETEEDAEEATGHQAGCSGGLSNGRMIMDTVK